MEPVLPKVADSAETAATPAPSRRKPGRSLVSANQRAECVRTRTAHPRREVGPLRHLFVCDRGWSWLCAAIGAAALLLLW